MASNPLLSFKNEILTKVVYPKLYTLLTADKGDISINDLWKKFRKSFECSVSFREFKEWCDELGLHQQQVVKWEIPETFRQVQYEEVRPTESQILDADGAAFNKNRFIPSEEDIDEVLFDNE
tara:strand:+ start:73 stop:438 length:366 start_codon:yes stop_codon:yes gene_type:complete